MDFPTTVEKIKDYSKECDLSKSWRSQVYIEDVGYQKAVIQQLTKEGFKAKGFKVNGKDKRARLDSVTYMIRSGKVLFPKEGSKDLIQQLVYFGVEKYDDLVDAFTIVLHQAVEMDRPRVKVYSRDVYNMFRYGSDYKPSYWNGDKIF
jgi:predicted phage terminase large subunit-like protein